ncbi:MAG: cysteine rich repeat-containing protein [Pseudomonadota bacterium]
MIARARTLSRGTAAGALCAALAGSLAWVAMPGIAAAQDVLGACEAELVEYCDGVTPGHGRILACLYAREDQLGDACDEAVGDVADVLDAFFERLNVAHDACAPEIRAHCADVSAGGGQIYQCLTARDDLSGECGDAITAFRPPAE